MNGFRRRLVAITAAVLALAMTSAASAATPTTPTVPPPAAKGAIKVSLPDLFVVHKQLVTVTGRGLWVSGVVRPYVAGQTVTITAYLGHKLIKQAQASIKPAHHGKVGHFSMPLSSSDPGHVLVYVTHVRSTGQVGFTAHRGFTVLGRGAGFGSRGPFMQLIQQQLAALHFYIPQTGVYDAGTGLALDAYHRLLRQGFSQNLDSRTVSFLLNGWGQFKVHFPSHGHHEEGDLTDQLLALIDGKNVSMIFPISSGKPSTPTVLGDFHVYSRVPGYLPDGMYYTDFFIGGYAIHGYNPAPDYPASHGCMRLPIADAIASYNWVHMGDWVDVYYE